MDPLPNAIGVLTRGRNPSLYFPGCASRGYTSSRVCAEPRCPRHPRGMGEIWLGLHRRPWHGIALQLTPFYSPVWQLNRYCSARYRRWHRERLTFLACSVAYVVRGTRWSLRHLSMLSSSRSYYNWFLIPRPLCCILPLNKHIFPSSKQFVVFCT